MLIRGNDLAKPLLNEIYREVVRAGAHARLAISFDEMSEILYREASPEQLLYLSPIQMFEAKNIDCMISILSPFNVKMLLSVDPRRMVDRAKALKPINEWIMGKVRWSLCNFPTPALAQEAEMSLSEYEDFLYTACLQDWPKRVKEMTRIAKVFEKADAIHIMGKETDLKMRIKGRKFIVGRGDFNMPDGEIFTGPIENSTNGKIYYEFPAIHGSREVQGVRL